MKKSPPAQADHPHPVQLGGKRSPKLRVIDPMRLPAGWEILPGVPKTRGDCARVVRPCPYLSCRHNLWISLQQEQPGNPKAGKQGETTFRPYSMRNCALDIAEFATPVDEIAHYMRIHPTRVRQIAEGALEKLRALDPDLARALMEAL